MHWMKCHLEAACDILSLPVHSLKYASHDWMNEWMKGYGKGMSKILSRRIYIESIIHLDGWIDGPTKNEHF